MRPGALLFADEKKAAAFPDVLRKSRALDDVRRTARLYQAHSEPAVGTEMLARLLQIFDSSP